MMVVVKFNLTYYLLSSNVWPEGPEIVNTLTANYVMDMMIGELYVITFVTAIKITSDWIQENKRSSDLEKAQLETQLLFLRSQVSPHFFFNTLNNIYSLSLEGSKRTPKVILKLSELMRYLIYDTKNKRQDLSNEAMVFMVDNHRVVTRVKGNSYYSNYWCSHWDPDRYEWNELLNDGSLMYEDWQKFGVKK